LTGSLAAHLLVCSRELVTSAFTPEDLDALVMLQRGSAYMVQKTQSSRSGPATRANAVDTTPPEAADLLGQVAKLLEEGQPAAALERISRSKLSSPWLTNAAGVCQLRLGDAKVAVDTFRGLVLAAGGVVLRDGVPAVFKINFATALLADGNLPGGLRVLDEIRDEGHPAVRGIRDAIRRWKEGPNRSTGNASGCVPICSWVWLPLEGSSHPLGSPWWTTRCRRRLGDNRSPCGERPCRRASRSRVPSWLNAPAPRPHRTLEGDTHDRLRSGG
jgi:hypothetical protein